MTEVEVYAFIAGIAVGVVLALYILMTIDYIKERRAHKQHEADLEFKVERLRPKPLPTQSSEALVEVDRPHARVSKGRIYPRRAKKRS